MNGIYSLKHVARTMNQGGPVKFKEPLQRDLFSPKLTSVAKQLPALAKKIPGPVGRGAAILEGLGQLPLIYDRISFSDPDEMGFRSVAEDVLGLPSFPNRGSAEQMEAALGQGKTKSLPKPVVAQIGNRKINKEELKFLGITDLLEEAKRTGQPVTKEQIQNAIESNRSNMYLKQEVLLEPSSSSILRKMDDPHDPYKDRIEVIDNEGLGVGVFARGTDEDEYWDIVVDGEISGSVDNENEARVRLIQEASKKGIQTKGAKHRDEVAEDYDMGDIGEVEKYREIVVRSPKTAGGDIGSHYGDDVAYHMRVSDREYKKLRSEYLPGEYPGRGRGYRSRAYTDSQGVHHEQVLYVDEIQSDYAQAGAGRKSPLGDTGKTLLKDLDIDAETKNLALSRFDSPETKAAREELFESIERKKEQLSNPNRYEALNSLIQSIGQNLKEQPLVAGQEKWVQHAIKSLITRMVNEGKDRLIFTSGRNQADFWGEKGLEKFYDKIVKNEVKDVLKGIDKDAFEMVDGAYYDYAVDRKEPLKHISIRNTQKIRDFLEGVGGKPRGFGGYSSGGGVNSLKHVARAMNQGGPVDGDDKKPKPTKFKTPAQGDLFKQVPKFLPKIPGVAGKLASGYQLLQPLISSDVPRETFGFQVPEKEDAEERSLLILGCCKTKEKDKGLVSAEELYSGPMYKALQKYREKNDIPENVDIAILSAKHGLIRLDDKIEDYDVTFEKNATLRNEMAAKPEFKATIKKALDNYKDVYVAAGEPYRDVIKKADDNAVRFNQYPQGTQRAQQPNQLKQYLHEKRLGGVGQPVKVRNKAIYGTFDGIDSKTGKAIFSDDEAGARKNRYNLEDLVPFERYAKGGGINSMKHIARNMNGGHGFA